MCAKSKSLRTPNMPFPSVLEHGTLKTKKPAPRLGFERDWNVENGQVGMDALNGLSLRNIVS